MVLLATILPPRVIFGISSHCLILQKTRNVFTSGVVLATCRLRICMGLVILLSHELDNHLDALLNWMQKEFCSRGMFSDVLVVTDFKNLLLFVSRSPNQFHKIIE